MREMWRRLRGGINLTYWTTVIGYVRTFIQEQLGGENYRQQRPGYRSASICASVVMQDDCEKRNEKKTKGTRDGIGQGEIKSESNSTDEEKGGGHQKGRERGEA